MQSQSMKVWWFIAGGLLAGVAVAFAAWALMSQSSAHEPLPYKLMPLDRGPITEVVMANGSLQPVSTVTVGSAVSGTVAARFVDFNAAVTKGQVMLKLDPTQFEARVRQAQGQLTAAQARLAFAEGVFERNQLLVGLGYIAAPQRDQSERDLNAARGEAEAALANLEATRKDLASTVIRAPVDGIVVRRTVDVGQTVVSSFQSPELFLIARNLRDMVIHVNVGEADVGQVKEGQPVRFAVDAFPAQEFEGSVSQLRLNATSSQGVVSYVVIVNVDNADGALKPGMTAQARIVVASRPQALRLPTAALRFKPDDGEVTGHVAADAVAGDDGALAPRRGDARLFSVYTLGSDHKLRQHAVTVGISNTRYAELLTGDLAPGDAVVTKRTRVAKEVEP